jgi:hypothetical protein
LHLKSLNDKTFKRNLSSTITEEDFKEMVEIEKIFNSQDDGKIIEIYTKMDIF